MIDKNMRNDDLIRRLNKKFPARYVAIELTNTCNLRCPLCSTGSGLNKKPKGMMKFSNFKKFMDECSPLLDMVGFIGSGEPMLHPKFLKFVEYTSQVKGKITECRTNGTTMKNPEGIVNAGLNFIHFDIEGLTQKQHQLYRVGSNLDTILNNIKSLIWAKRKLDSYYPEIIIDTLISRYNENDYDGLIEMAKELEVNAINFNGIMDDIYDTTNWFPTLEEFKHVKRNGDYTCFFKDSIAGILSWDGESQLCCMTPNHENPLVKMNVYFEDDLLTRMDSEDFYNLTKNSGNYDFCETCFLKVYSTYQKKITIVPLVSVILCTYNPRMDLLEWALESLEQQTLDKSQFEVIVVDNNSSPPLNKNSIKNAEKLPLRIIREPRQGLTFSRCAGIAEASANLLVFIDDDNHLDPDYLENAIKIAAKERHVGLYGGISKAVLESPIHPWKNKMLSYLGVRDYGMEPITSFEEAWGEWEPIGAGMVSRRDVAKSFVQTIKTTPMAGELGRKGKTLLSAEDSLFARMASRLGYACSYQPTLRLSHFMKNSRLKPLNLCRTLQGHGRSFVLLEKTLGKPIAMPSFFGIWRILLGRFILRIYRQGLRAGAVEWFWDLGFVRESLNKKPYP